MKARADAIIRLEQAEYLEQLHPASVGVLAEMEAYAAEHRVPIADREVALFLEITARAINARRVLEIGMAIGYSVIHLLRGMPEDGEVVTIEPSDEMITRARDYFARMGMGGRGRGLVTEYMSAAHWADPLDSNEMRVSTSGFVEMTQMLARLADELCAGRLALTLEGGYDLAALSSSVVAIAMALSGGTPRDVLGPPPGGALDDVGPALDRVKRIHGL